MPRTPSPTAMRARVGQNQMTPVRFGRGGTSAFPATGGCQDGGWVASGRSPGRSAVSSVADGPTGATPAEVAVGYDPAGYDAAGVAIGVPGGTSGVRALRRSWRRS